MDNALLDPKAITLSAALLERSVFAALCDKIKVVPGERPRHIDVFALFVELNQPLPSRSMLCGLGKSTLFWPYRSLLTVVDEINAHAPLLDCHCHPSGSVLTPRDSCIILAPFLIVLVSVASSFSRVCLS